jgi:hypothetical protein
MSREKNAVVFAEFLQCAGLSFFPDILFVHIQPLLVLQVYEFSTGFKKPAVYCFFVGVRCQF